MSAVDQFPVLLSEAEEESSAVPPCFSHEGINVCHGPACRAKINQAVLIIALSVPVHKAQ